MEIKVTLTADEKLTGLVNSLIQALNPATVKQAKPATVIPMAEKQKEAESKTETVSETKAPPAPTQPGKVITIEQVRAAVQERSAKHKETIKTILKEFNVQRVTDLSKEQYEPFLSKVEAL